jgi:putative SOS response-associated peptidase YedK
MKSIIEELAIEEWENPENYIPNYNIAPTQISPILLDRGKRIVKPMRWGLIPSWAKDNKFASKMINARIETLTEKPSYRNLLTKNRCIVIADGYYEWKNENGKKTPYYLKHSKDKLMTMAGLFDLWRNPEGQLVPTYTIITKDAQQIISNIHHRMPVILPPENINIWMKTSSYSVREALDTAQNIKPDIVNYPVSTLVNSVKNNSPDCIKPA